MDGFRGGGNYEEYSRNGLGNVCTVGSGNPYKNTSGCVLKDIVSRCLLIFLSIEVILEETAVLSKRTKAYGNQGWLIFGRCIYLSDGCLGTVQVQYNTVQYDNSFSFFLYLHGVISRDVGPSS